jgi:hypothetical protein
LISTKTVFVLGAGASFPYGFPLGSQLKRLVLECYKDAKPHAVHLYNTTSFDTAAAGEFINALQYSGLSSVDAFLERRPQFLDIGKATMGIELLIKESVSDLWKEQENWLTYLYANHMVGSSVEEFADNCVSFVTFNYDRVVEHFFHTSLMSTFGKGIEETGKIVEQIPVIHLHGRLGFLPWQNTQGVVPYGAPTIDKQVMDTLLNEIKVVHEDITDVRDKEFTRAKELLAEAERVYLLGFGFGARNVERLGLKQLPHQPGVPKATAAGLTQHEVNQVASALLNGKVDLRITDCIGLLRNVAALD